MSTKSYKRGVADTAHAFEEFERKQSDAINFVRENFVEGIHRNINDLCDHITEQEKNALYKFSVPFDIRNLEEHEKSITVGILYLLANEKSPTEYQKSYIQFLQKYINVKEYSRGIDISAIENIDSITVQKAIFQIVIEYLALQDGDAYDETDVQNALISSFSINKKVKDEIIERVELIYKILGKDGVSKKYETVNANDEKNTLPAKEKIIMSAKKLNIYNLASLLQTDIFLGRKIYKSDIIDAEYSNRLKCLVVAISELKKTYNSASELFNPNSNKSIAILALNSIMSVLSAQIENIRHDISMLPTDIFHSEVDREELLKIANAEELRNKLKAILDKGLQSQKDTYAFPGLNSYTSKIEVISDESGGFFNTKWFRNDFLEIEIEEEVDRLVELYADFVSEEIDAMLTNMTHKIEELLT